MILCENGALTECIKDRCKKTETSKACSLVEQLLNNRSCKLLAFLNT